MIDALHACFGIPPDAPAHVVVGVAPDAPRAEVLERATERLRAVHARFMEDDPAFIAARARLRAAARELVDRPGTRMEADDLRALVASSGGWNATARMRALRWAAMHGIDPATLVELLGGPSAPASGPVATTPSFNERRERERSWLPLSLIHI